MELTKKPHVSGRCGSGKSQLMRSLLYDYQKQNTFKFVLCYCPTKFTGDWDGILPDEYIRDDYSDENFMKHIKKLKKWKESNPDKELPQSLIIMSDMMSRINWYCNHEISNFLISHRHYKVSLWMDCQYLQTASTNTVMREICNYAFLFNTKYANSLKGYHLAFGNLFDDYKEFCEYFQNLTKTRYTCMVYDASKESKEDNYWSFQAPATIPKFALKYKI
jgi:hypothetical protein